MNILVTGSAGMLGKHIKKYFTTSKIEAFFTDRKNLDLNVKKNIDKFLKSNKINIVIHCAGVVGNAYDNKDNAYNCLNENLNIGLNIAKSCLDNNVEILLNISSPCIYPKITHRNIKETDLNLSIINDEKWAYSLSKLVVTKNIQEISKSNNVKFKSVIPCNLYGEYDNFDKNSHLIPSIYNKILEAKNKKLKSVQMWGDGSARRELMYADDFVRALIFIINNINKIPDIINIGVEEDHSIKTIYRIISKVIKWNGELINDVNKYTGPKKRKLCIDTINEIGFKVETKLENGIKKIHQFKTLDVK